MGNLINYENHILVTFGHIPVPCWAQRPWGCSWAGSSGFMGEAHMAQGARKRGHGNQEFVTFVTWLYSLWNLTDYENRFFVTFVTFQRNAVVRGAGAAAGLALAAPRGGPGSGRLSPRVGP